MNNPLPVPPSDQSEQPEEIVYFTPRAMARVTSFAEELRASGDPRINTEEVKEAVAASASYFAEAFSAVPWFKEQPVHEFIGYQYWESGTKPDFRTAKRLPMKLVKSDGLLNIWEFDELILPEEYYVERVLAEAGLPEYQEYADWKMNPDQDMDTHE